MQLTFFISIKLIASILCFIVAFFLVFTAFGRLINFSKYDLTCNKTEELLFDKPREPDAKKPKKKKKKQKKQKLQKNCQSGLADFLDTKSFEKEADLPGNESPTDSGFSESEEVSHIKQPLSFAFSYKRVYLPDFAILQKITYLLHATSWRKYRCIGENFMKSTMAMKLFFEKNPWNGQRNNEGAMSLKRFKKLARLEKLGQARGLQRLLTPEMSFGLPDMILSLIGFFLQQNEAAAAVEFLKWLQVPAMNPATYVNSDTGCEYSSGEGRRLYKEWKLEEVEETLGYSFKRKQLLVQALTHSSCSQSRAHNYERLEFLGDALLDHLLTFSAAKMEKSFEETELEGIKLAFASNRFLASIAVKFDLHRFLRHQEPGLAETINCFVSRCKTGRWLKTPWQRAKHTHRGILRPPKQLADLVEALIGAIFIDCDKDLDKVWQIVYRLIKDEFDCFLKNSSTCRLEYKAPFPPFPRASLSIIESLNAPTTISCSFRRSMASYSAGGNQRFQF